MPKPAPLLDPGIYAVALDDSPYFRFYEKSPVTRLLLATIPRHLARGMSVLDIGCGNAIAACHLVASGGRALRYVGVDPDPAVCGWARKVLASLPPAQLRGEIVTRMLEDYLAGEPSRVDLIVSNWACRAYIDLGRPERHGPIARAIAGQLQPGGVLLVGDAHIAPGASEEEIERIRRHHQRLVGERGTGRPLVPPELIVSLFEQAGLVCLERHDVGAVPLAHVFHIPHDRYALHVFRRPGDER